MRRSGNAFETRLIRRVYYTEPDECCVSDKVGLTLLHAQMNVAEILMAMRIVLRRANFIPEEHDRDHRRLTMAYESTLHALLNPTLYSPSKMSITINHCHIL